MRTKASLRKLVTGCSKHCFEVADETDEAVTYIMQVKLTWFEEIFEEYHFISL
ncbi:hypothetical protein [Streptococcus pneumoniae]|uniref:hypothetical protein n=1 Tax=Streptococcus pneumoniae TaxID=1313 RepID=UPI0015D96BAF|nr:hypothetical protein [Streptococcus pneumoniae]